MHRYLLAVLVACLVCSCTSVPKIVRQSRPESIVLKHEIRYHSDFGRGTDFVLPAGDYRYAWEDKGSWYYENLSVALQANIVGRIPVSRPGGFSIAKEYDQIGIYLLCERQDLRQRGVGDLVISMLPKRDGKIVSVEGVIPKTVEVEFEMIGSVTMKMTNDRMR
jgi:hypothetical protein